MSIRAVELKRVQRQDWRTPEERAELLATVAQMRPALGQMAFMLWSPDSAVRQAGYALVAARRNDRRISARLLEILVSAPASARHLVARTLARLNLPDWEATAAEYLNHANEQIREVAEEMVLETAMTATARPLFTAILEGGQHSRRERALLRCFEAGDERVLRAIIDQFPSFHDDLRRFAWNAFRSTGSPRFLDLYCDWLGRENHANREIITAAIAELDLDEHQRRVTDKVLELLTTGEAGPRVAAMWLLKRLPNRAAAIREFLEFARSMPGWVRERAFDSMRELGDGLADVVVELLACDDTEIQASALFLASGIKPDPRLVGPMIGLLSHDDWWIRINAIDGLGHQGDGSAVPHLLPFLQDAELRASAIHALAAIGDPTSLQPIVNLLRDRDPDVRMDVLRALRVFCDKRSLRVLQQITTADPDPMVRAEAYAVAKDVAALCNVTVDEQGMRSGLDDVVADGPANSPLVDLMIKARAMHASDLHVGTGIVPQVRLDGTLQSIEGASALDADELTTHLTGLLNEEQRTRLREDLQVDVCVAVRNAGRYRGNIYLDRKGPAAVFRIIPTSLPTLVSAGLPSAVAQVGMCTQGIVLVCGPSGCGKSTTLAALVNLINDTRQAHVITLEDPIEFVHPIRNSVVNQRELGTHCQSYARALRAALRENPDVIVVGDLRDRETTRLALEASETGHLVITTLSSASAVGALVRLIQDFPPAEQPQVRIMLAAALRMVIAQSLVPSASGRGMTPVFEVAIGTAVLANLIREGKMTMIESAIQTGRAQGMQSFDDALMELVHVGKITPETAFSRARSKQVFEGMVDATFLGGAAREAA